MLYYFETEHDISLWMCLKETYVIRWDRKVMQKSWQGGMGGGECGRHTVFCLVKMTVIVWL